MGQLRLVLLLPLVLVACGETTRTRQVSDAGLDCGDNERLINGECVFVCDRDPDCPEGQRCNLLLGTCEPKPAVDDAGVMTFPCTTGATRCRTDNAAVEECSEAGLWIEKEACAAGGFCLNEQCLACKPGQTSCNPADVTQVTVCLDDGSGTRLVQCQGGGTCVQGECRECAPNTSRCSPDGKNVQTCQKTADETLTWKWTNSGDNFDGTCITQQCVAGATPMCKPPECIPGTVRCGSNTRQDVCSAIGSWEGTMCSTLPGMSPLAECQNGVCVDECGDAAKLKSYFGCEYWTAITDNLVDRYFKGGTTSGQGTTTSDFAFVVTNRSVNSAVVTVYRWLNNAESQVTQVTVPGSGDPATKGLAVIKVPWQSIGGSTAGAGVTGRARYGYRITSTRPVTVYQFNPLDAVKTAGACNNDNGCTAAPLGVCKVPASGGGKVCHYFTYSNDASLLLPAHILGTQYVAMLPHHIKGRQYVIFGYQDYVGFNGQLTMVATEDNTSVTVKSKAKMLSGTSVAALAKGATATYTLNKYEVLQLSTDNDGANLECSADPFNPIDELCRSDNDATGSVVTSSKPIALFGGSACTLVPFNQTACDHVEEQIFPFSTWGKSFVAVRSHALRRSDGTFAPASTAGPDYYKVVASCPATQCPNGTTITFNTPPAAADVLAPNRCATGTSLQANNCRLMGGDFMEFKSKSSFTLSADFPIALGMFLAGQNATTGTPIPDEGDPSFILLPPVEQWRAQYTVLAAPGIRDNYLGLAIDHTRVDKVFVDGAVVTLTPISGTSFSVANHPVTVGTHTVTVTPKPGQTQIPGGGVIVYGFDSYVSYGYTGGLDLGSIVSGIDPGG